MIEFTTPQSGDPQKNKSVLAYQVRRHAARVAAARSKNKFHRAARVTNFGDGSGSPHESCFAISLDSDTGRSRKTSTTTVKKPEKCPDSQSRTKPPRHRWTSIYKLDMPKTLGGRTSHRAPRSTTTSPPSTDSSKSEIDWRTSDRMGLMFDDADAMQWGTPLESFLDASSNPSKIEFGSDGPQEDTSSSYQSLLTSGKHIPDVHASLLAFELGSGFQDIGQLPLLLQQAQRRAVCATVALDQYQRKSAGAPLLADIVDEAEESQRAFQEVDIAFSASSTTESLVADCCRLAGLIYCELVLFPSRAEHDVIPGLVGDLRLVLETVDFWVCDEQSVASISHMLLWATVLGAMAETASSKRTWFKRRLATSLFLDARQQEWEYLRGSVSKFLWWRPICDYPARKVWQEAVEQCRLADEGAQACAQ